MRNYQLPSCEKAARYLFACFALVTCLQLKAQDKNLYAYQDLSQLAYARQKDSLKKSWSCPTLYKNKETQKKYKEIWEARTDFMTTAIQNNDYILEKEISGYLNGIIDELVKGNPKLLTAKPVLLVDRSSAVNAYAVGSNLLAVNLGLISFAQSKEEIALVIAHELSHNIMNHAEKSMQEKAEWLTSDNYKKSLNSVLDSKYERFSRLQKLVEGYTFSRGKHHRYHESDADSLAIVLLKNSHIGFDARFFLRLDSVDIQYRQPLKKPVKEYFSGYNLSIEDAWVQKRSKGLSTKNYNFRDTTNIEDSVKTHPDCSVRYANTLKLSDKDIRLTPVPAAIKEKANRIALWNMFDNLSLTACLYRILLEKDNGNTDAWYDFMIHNIFSGLYYSDKQLNRFNAIGILPKEYISKDYYELQNMLEQIPREKLEQFCHTLQSSEFWRRLPSDANALRTLMASLNFATTDSENDKVKAAKNFISNNNASMYCEFADHFKGK